MLSRFCFCFPHLLHIGLHVEISEEDYERQHVNYKGVVHPERKFATGPNSIDAKYQSACELYLKKEMRGVSQIRLLLVVLICF